MRADARFTRQARLAEVGEAGQARLSSAEVRVSGAGLAGEVLARYLRGAGVRVATGEADPPEEAPEWLASLSPAAREVASGAHAALTVVRAVLAGKPHARVSPRGGGG